MCRMLGYVTKSATTIPTLLGDSYPSFECLSKVQHGDGWGLAWLEDGFVKVKKAPVAAENDPLYHDTVTKTLSNAAILHYRWATMNLSVTLENTHPFLDSDIAFCHNGSIPSLDVLESYIDSRRHDMIHGSTDSEAYFGAILSSGFEDDPLDVLVSTIRKLVESCTYSSLNAMILTPRTLYVVSAYNDEEIPKGFPKDYYKVRYQNLENGIVVASSGWNQKDWLELPNNTVFEVAVDGSSHVIHDLYEL